MEGQQSEKGGTGSRFARLVIILAGISALAATLLTFVSVWLQSKNYRKPLLQRYVIRILLMVPIYSIASWASLISLRAAFWIAPFRDVYEAFTLYTFFQLLINFLGGERSLIIMMHGRPPVRHLWPLNYCFPKVDISDPHSFLSIKRGILQYTWVKPLLAVATIVLKATGTYQEGYIGLSSGYLWLGIIYNISICWSLYDLALFWVVMSTDMRPFRPMPKFLCIKGIIFASYWQGFFLSILVWLGAIPDMTGGYTADNLAAAIQDALICFEMPLFAMAHWYAFSWKDYADKTISDARMPIRFALRDAFGPRDLIQDAKETFSGSHYEYRYFDADDNVIAHEESSSRQARMREGMRYERGGRGKYWIPQSNGPDAKTPLLSKLGGSQARTMSPGVNGNGTNTLPIAGTLDSGARTSDELQEAQLDAEEERLYTNARALEFGDWNYPVINTHYASRDDQLCSDPNIITASSNRNLLQPTTVNKQRRKSRIKDIQSDSHQGQRENSGQRGSSSSGEASSSRLRDAAAHLPVVGSMLRQHSSSSSNSASSQLVDLVVEDREAEDIERVRARKEGGPGWNEVERKHFVKAYPDGQDDQAEEVRQGFNPDRPETRLTDEVHNLDSPFAVVDDDAEDGPDENGRGQRWDGRDYSAVSAERDAWGKKDNGER